MSEAPPPLLAADRVHCIEHGNESEEVPDGKERGVSLTEDDSVVYRVGDNDRVGLIRNIQPQSYKAEADERRQ